ncbi:RNase H domain-containing protein [Trichonephila clavipes]|nr:RNase H domain-containing protein [Trichonephila clavipes]
MESLVTPLRSIQTAAYQMIEQASSIYIEKRREISSFYRRNPEFSSVFKSKLNAIECDPEAVLNGQDLRDLCIISDSHGSLQHLCNWIADGDKAGISMLQKLRQISGSHDAHFHWIHSYVEIFGNEQVDLLAK